MNYPRSYVSVALLVADAADRGWSDRVAYVGDLDGQAIDLARTIGERP